MFCFVMGKIIHPEYARTLVTHYIVTSGWWWGTYMPPTNFFFPFLFLFYHFCLAVDASVKTQAFLKAGSTHPPSYGDLITWWHNSHHKDLTKKRKSCVTTVLTSIQHTKLTVFQQNISSMFLWRNTVVLSRAHISNTAQKPSLIQSSLDDIKHLYRYHATNNCLP